MKQFASLIFFGILMTFGSLKKADHVTVIYQQEPAQDTTNQSDKLHKTVIEPARKLAVQIESEQEVKIARIVEHDRVTTVHDQWATAKATRLEKENKLLRDKLKQTEALTIELLNREPLHDTLIRKKNIFGRVSYRKQ